MSTQSGLQTGSGVPWQRETDKRAGKGSHNAGILTKTPHNSLQLPGPGWLGQLEARRYTGRQAVVAAAGGAATLTALAAHATPRGERPLLQAAPQEAQTSYFDLHELNTDPRPIHGRPALHASIRTLQYGATSARHVTGRPTDATVCVCV